jgi:hypothetical protein
VENILTVWHSIGWPLDCICDSVEIDLLFETHNPAHSRIQTAQSLKQRRWEYCNCLAFYWSQGENILTVWHSIGHKERIFSRSGILLVTSREYFYCLAFYWPQGENILTVWHSIGDKSRIFLLSGSLLATRREYSHCLAFCWSQFQIFLLSGILLVTRREYSHCWHSIGHKSRGGRRRHDRWSEREDPTASYLHQAKPGYLEVANKKAKINSHACKEQENEVFLWEPVTLVLYTEFQPSINSYSCWAEAWGLTCCIRLRSRDEGAGGEVVYTINEKAVISFHISRAYE